jgi:hypothetical protein
METVYNFGAGAPRSSPLSADAVHNMHEAWRDALMGLPPVLALRIATMSDPFEIELLPRSSVRRVLTACSIMTIDDLIGSMTGDTG